MARWMMNRLMILAALLALSTGAQAAPLIDKVGGDLRVTALFDGTNLTFDVRGLVLLGVQDPAVPIPLTGVTLADASGGTDTTGAVVPFGNPFLLAADGTPGLAVLAFLDFANVSFSGPVLTVPVFFASFAGTPLPNSALEGLVNNSAIPLHFQFLQSIDLGQSTLTQWGLVTAAVPEPSTFPLVGVGLFAIAGMIRRRRKTL